jgi:hypothetical protein
MKTQRPRCRALGAASLLAAICLWVTPLAAAGALAIGTTGDVGKDGVAIGSQTDVPTRDQAMTRALAECRDNPGAPDAAKLCRVVGTFVRECYATAFNPTEGAPGLGWAILSDQATAKQRAMAGCLGTGGNESCEVALSGCDIHD